MIAAYFLYKKPPVGVSQPGELVIRVHLPIKCSRFNHHVPDKFIRKLILVVCQKKQEWILTELGELKIKGHPSTNQVF